MSASEPTRPDTGRLDPASTTPHGAETHRDAPHQATPQGAKPAQAHREAQGLRPRRIVVPRLEGTRLEQCLGAALCVLALAVGVWSGLRLRRASDDAEPLPERRAEVASMSPAAKDQLRHQYVRFVALPPEQQQRMRDFDAELATADDAEQLRETLKRFSDWLRTVSLVDRNELVKMAGQPERRVRRVEELSPLSRTDADALDKWIKQLPPRPPFSWWSEADLNRLAGQLSELRQGELARRKSVADKRGLVWGWVQRRRAPTEPGVSPASNDELVRFYTDDLPDESRRKLLAMPREPRNRELRDEYRKFDRKLERFFADDLSDAARQRLSALSPEQRKAELREEYRKFESELKRYFEEELSEAERKRLSALSSEQRDRDLRKLYRQARSRVPTTSSDGQQ